MVEIGKPNMPPSSEFPYQALTPSGFSISTSTRCDSSTLEMRASPRSGGFSYPVTTRVMLHAGAPYIDLEMTIEKPADNWPEAGWICLPFKVDKPQFRVGSNGFIMDPAKDIIAGANRYMYAVGTMVTAFCRNPHGTGTLLRLWEQVGAGGSLTITIPGNFTTATPVGLRGEKKSTAPLRITDGKLTFPLDAYAPASFVLE